MFKEIINEIEKANRILLSAHVNPDGDAVGATLAMYLALNEYNKQKKSEDEEYFEKVVRLILQDNIPKNLEFLFGSEMVENDNGITSKYDFDLMICLDSATKERLGSTIRHMKDGTKVINIDHHTSNTMYGHINYVEEISSTSEITYSLIKEMGIEISKEIGEALYTGLVNDTGNFAHSNVTKDTLLMASHLVEKGVDNSKIVREFFTNKNMASLKIMGMALQEMVYVEEKKATYFYLSSEALESVGGIKEDTEGIVNLINSYTGSEVSIFLIGKNDGTIKGSLRSKHDVDVNKIASVFGGGGHVKAAGFTAIDMSVDEVVETILKRL